MIFVIVFLLAIVKMFAIQEGMALAKGDGEAKTFLLSVMDELETVSNFSGGLLTLYPLYFIIVV